MNYKFFFYTILVLFLCSCKKDIKKEVQTIKKNNKSIIVKHKNPPSINKVSSNKISSWKAYGNFKEFLERFEETSPNDAFGNVKELKDLTTALKDSLTIKKFKTPAFKARLNVLENEVLRLDDMANITAITSNEVNLQIDKIFLVFGSLNQKINTLYNHERFEKEIDLDIFFKNDSI